MGRKLEGFTRVKIRKGLTLVKRGEVWYAEECRRGVQTRRSLGTADLQEATRRAAVGPDDASVLNPVLKSKTPEALTLGKAFEEYEAWYEKNKRASGARRALPVVRRFLDLVGETTDVRGVTREHVQRWVDSRLDGRAGVTVRNDFARVRAFLRWIAARKGVVDWNLTRGIEKPKDDEVTAEAPSADRVRAVLAKLRSHA